MASGWLVRRELMVLGPFSDDEMSQHIARGKVTPADLVQRAGWDNWFAAEQVKDLSDSFASVMGSAPSRPASPSDVVVGRQAALPPLPARRMMAAPASGPPLPVTRPNPSPASPPQIPSRLPASSPRSASLAEERRAPTALGERVQGASQEAGDGSPRATLWFTSREGSVAGPFDLGAVRNAICEGRLTSHDLVREVNGGKWLRVAELAWLKDLLPPPPAVPPEVRSGQHVGGQATSRSGVSSVDCFGLVGRQLDQKYSVERAVAEGGFGVVYQGKHLALRKTVAIKVMRVPSDVHANSMPLFLERFAEEARTVAHLDHPAIVRVIDFGTSQMPVGGVVPWMVLEWLAGTTLQDDLASRGPGAGRTPVEAIALLRPVFEAVAYAHDAGIVHRDIKPANLMSTEKHDGGLALRVLDFGIAKLVAPEELATSGQTATHAGLSAFSLAYAAPEQVGRTRTGAWTDVHALGLVLTEVLTGTPPYRGHDSTELCASVLSAQRPTPSRFGVDVGAWEPVIARAVAMSPSDRFPNVRDFLRVLEEALPSAGHRVVEVQRTQISLFPPPVLSTTLAAASVPVHASIPPPNHAGIEATVRKSLVTLRRNPGVVGGVSLGMLIVSFVLVQLSTGHRRRELPEATAGTQTPPAAARSHESSTSINPWILVDAAQPFGRRGLPRLGIGTNEPTDTVKGFRVQRRIFPPTTRYEIQQHEVTWAEVDPWIERTQDTTVSRPPWRFGPGPALANLPATGIPWTTALAYCHEIGGSLPTEEEWEWAARGSELRPYPWGVQPIDLVRTHAFAGAEGVPTAVMSNDQDQTPGDFGKTIFDMAGNALEWTADLYRSDRPSEDESWVQSAGTTFRAVRGLPLRAVLPIPPPRVGAAWREPLCATGSCAEGTSVELWSVGFRCVRRVRGVADGN